MNKKVYSLAKKSIMGLILLRNNSALFILHYTLHENLLIETNFRDKK